MGDSIERLCLAALAAKSGHLADRAPVSARPRQDGQKVAEEAIAVAIDSIGGDSEVLIRESADLL